MKRILILTLLILNLSVNGLMYAESKPMSVDVITFSIPETVFSPDLKDPSSQDVLKAFGDFIEFQFDSPGKSFNKIQFQKQVEKHNGSFLGHPIFDIKPGQTIGTMFFSPLLSIKNLMKDSDGVQKDSSQPPGIMISITLDEMNGDSSRYLIEYEFELGLAQPQAFESADLADTLISRHAFTEKIVVEPGKWYVITITTLEKQDDKSIHQIWVLMRLTRPE